MDTAIWWIRRDLRLADNQALEAARRQAGRLVPLFILDPDLLTSPSAGKTRLAFMLAALRDLSGALQARGSRLIMRHGRPGDVLPELLSETGAEAVFAEQDYSPYSRRRDTALARTLPMRFVEGLTIFPPGSVTKADGQPYTIYTPFSRAWRALPQAYGGSRLAPPDDLPRVQELRSDPIPSEPFLPDSVPFPPNQAEARRRLRRFTEGSEAAIYRYARQRDRMDLEGTSGLSPYLKFGMLSARQAASAAWSAYQSAPDTAAAEGPNTWLSELIWRDFYFHVLAHFPHVARQAFRPGMRSILWINDEAHFEAWCRGRTGYPVVDAAMRQLLSSGWMHNRARMIVASFLTKDLLIDWRWGERWFMQHLVDGDLSANNGGWQWVAGTGTDAAPYFRIFNPTTQARKFDPQGSYIRRWLPELRSVPDRFIHEPREMPADTQREAGCRIGSDYPVPIVDHKQARLRALAVYGAARGQSTRPS